MRDRCRYPTNSNFKHYGGRGIKVCDRWQSFANFLADMGERPPGTTIDRYPDKNGDYEPNNCRWSTKPRQSSNRRRYTYNKPKAGRKFDEATIRSIRADTRSNEVIAAEQGVSRRLISAIKAREIYRDLP